MLVVHRQIAWATTRAFIRKNSTTTTIPPLPPVEKWKNSFRKNNKEMSKRPFLRDQLVADKIVKAFLPPPKDDADPEDAKVVIEAYPGASYCYLFCDGSSVATIFLIWSFFLLLFMWLFLSTFHIFLNTCVLIFSVPKSHIDYRTCNVNAQERERERQNHVVFKFATTISYQSRVVFQLTTTKWIQSVLLVK